jgi:cysteine synthase B
MTPALTAVRAADSITGNIGNTPLLRLRRLAADLPGIEIHAKAEYFNPGGSVKDRPALSMILAGEQSGAFTADKILLDSTSGNTGIAYAMICAAKGYRVKLCLPGNASPERKRILQAYGAELILTDPAEGSDGSTRLVKKIYAEDPNRYFYPDQYGNDANWQAHYNTTAVEILEQTDGRVTHFCALVGTGGTLVGTSRRLRREIPTVESICVQPSSGFHGLEGTRHLPTSIVPRIYDPTVPQRTVEVDTEEAHAMVKRLAREEGILAGVSSGGNVCAALQIGRQLVREGRRGVIVTILCDGADKYLSERFWDEEV